VPVWAPAPQGTYEIRAWSGQAVVFVARTGDTHCLDAAASALIGLMREQGPVGRSSAQWLRLFLGEDGAEDEPAAADTQRLEELLAGLEGIGLVTRLDPPRPAPH
jgi:hypothetical protein